MITVYDKKGVEHSKHPVDAHECVSILGWTLEPKKKKAKTKAELKLEKEAAELLAKEEAEALAKEEAEIKAAESKSK